MIRRRDPGHFDHLAGPVVLSAFLFFAVLANFIIRGSLFACRVLTLITSHTLSIRSCSSSEGTVSANLSFSVVASLLMTPQYSSRRKGVPIPGADLLGFATVNPTVVVPPYTGQAVF